MSLLPFRHHHLSPHPSEYFNDSQAECSMHTLTPFWPSLFSYAVIDRLVTYQSHSLKAYAITLLSNLPTKDWPRFDITHNEGVLHHMI